MPSGIQRSTFIRPFAEALGISMQAVRDTLNEAGYKAPYLDVRRALRILQEHGRDIRGCLKAVGMTLQDLESPAPSHQPPIPAANALVLTQPPSQAQPPSRAPPPTPLPASESEVTQDRYPTPPPTALIARLAMATEAGNTVANRNRLRNLLESHGYDFRSRKEQVALEILHRLGIRVENFISKDQDIVAYHKPNLDTNAMGVGQLRQTVETAMKDLVESQMETRRLKLMMMKVKNLLTLANDRAIQNLRDGRQRLTRAESVTLDALGFLEEEFSEDA